MPGPFRFLRVLRCMSLKGYLIYSVVSLPLCYLNMEAKVWWHALPIIFLCMAWGWACGQMFYRRDPDEDSWR